MTDSPLDRRRFFTRGLSRLLGEVVDAVSEKVAPMPYIRPPGAIAEPPPGTRAFIRGRCIQKFSEHVLSAQWDHITLQGSRRPLRISLLNLFTPAELALARQAVEAARQPDDLAGIAEPATE